MVRQSTSDTLTDAEQAVVRASWDEQVAGDVVALDLTEQLRASGKPWAVADADGNVVWREPPGPAGT